MTEAVEGGHYGIDGLKQQWHQAVEAGRLEEALEILDGALALALAEEKPQLIDLMICDRAAVAIELGRGSAEIPRLREILVRNADTANCRVAAYNIARSLRAQTRTTRRPCSMPASHATALSCWTAVTGWRRAATSWATTLLAESHVEQATEQYERALHLTSSRPTVARGMIPDNLGYCRILQGRYEEAYSLLYQSLRLLRRLAPEIYQLPPRLDLCFRHIETGRYERALRQGIQALDMAEETRRAGFLEECSLPCRRGRESARQLRRCTGPLPAVTTTVLSRCVLSTRLPARGRCPQASESPCLRLT